MFVTNYLMLVILGLPFTPMPQHTILLVGGADSETATLSTETVDDLCRIKFVSVTRSTTTAGCVDQGKLAAWTRMRVYPC
jgi:hypothetical protein